MVPPSTDVPAPNDGQTSYPGDFDFQRLGIRIPTLLISPWIRKGTVVSAPPEESKPYPNSEFDLTSIMVTARLLLGMPSTPLTDRDAWSASFESALDFTMDGPRTDCPLHLPDAIPPEDPSYEQHLPLNELQRDIRRVHSQLAGVEIPDYDVQGEHSEWVQGRFNHHSMLTRHYQGFTDSRFKLITQPEPLFRDVDEECWDMNGLKYGGNPTYENSTMPYITVSTMHMRVDLGGSDGVPLCLDGGAGTEGTLLRVRPCLPSPDPTYNRVRGQQFVYPGDGTLRLYQDGSDKELCVTNHNPNVNIEGVRATLITTLEMCSGAVEQSWAYHGSAPGRSMQGQLFYGDWANALGVVDTSKESK